MKKLLFLLIALLIIVGASLTLASAETFSQSTATSFQKTCTNSSGGICESGSTCELTVRFPRNNTIVFQNQSMSTGGDGLFEKNFTEGNLAIPGKYNWDMFCCSNGNCGEAHGTFQVTTTGVELTKDKALIYLGMLALLIFIFMVNMAGIALLPSSNTADEDEILLGVNKLKYLRAVLFPLAWGLLLSILFTASNISFLYLETTMMAQLLFVLYKFMMLMSTPMVILWGLWILARIFQDKQIKELLDRGVPIQGGTP